VEARDDYVVTHDFSDFDQGASRYLDEFHFTAFNMPCMPGSIAGHEQGTPEYEALFTSYARQIQDHLEAKGWLDKAYIYWFDEPEPRDYDFVKEGIQEGLVLAGCAGYGLDIDVAFFEEGRSP